MTQEKKHRIISAAVSVGVHLILIVILSMLTMEYVPESKEDDGVPVMLGDLSDAEGDGAEERLASNDVEQEANVKETPEVAQPNPEPAIPEPVKPEEPLMSQKNEPSVNVAEEKRKEEEAERKRQEELRKEEERRKAEEAERKRKEEEERKRREAAERANSKVAGAFGNAKANGNNGQTQGEGLQGTPDGNANQGATTGVGGAGVNPVAKVGSRTPMSLPRPDYVDKQGYGKVVVEVTVNRSGKVTHARIKSTTATQVMNNEALKKARESIFSAGPNDAEVGTITYNFNLT